MGPVLMGSRGDGGEPNCAMPYIGRGGPVRMWPLGGVVLPWLKRSGAEGGDSGRERP